MPNLQMSPPPSHPKTGGRLGTLSLWLVVALGLLQPLAAWCQQLAQVEVIWFERKGLAKTAGLNLANDGKDLRYPEATQALTEPQPSGPAFSLLPDTSFSLTSQAQRISSSKSLRLLGHQSWLQPLGSSPILVEVKAGGNYGDYHELAGTMTLSRGKHIEVSIDAWLTQFMPDNGHPVANPLQLPRLDGSSARPAGFIATQIVTVKTERNIPEDSLAYLDHPVVGALIKVTLVDGR